VHKGSAVKQAQDGQKRLSAALGRLPSGLFVLTARRGQAETGMLTSWVQQCAFDPPAISVAIKNGRAILGWLTEESPFTLNILDDTQTDMVAHFGRGFSLEEPAFDGLEIEHPGRGAPVLAEALAYLECTVTRRFSVGDHELFVARVTGGNLLGEGQPMVHVRKSGMHY
jgi:flavin reductase (DIM6/NTAB) family NADH-FMN oxidoreductase RutF